MIGNVLKTISALIFGGLLGLLFGAISGALLGAIPGLFFLEIILFKQTILMSITLVLILAGLLGLMATGLVNKFFDVNDRPLIGVMLGIFVGIIVIVFKVGVIGYSDLDTSSRYIYFIPIFYGEIAGSEIGSIIFSISGAAGVIRTIIRNRNAAKNNKQKLEEIKKSLGMDASEEKRG